MDYIKTELYHRYKSKNNQIFKYKLCKNEIY